MKSVVSARGQVTIPKALRDRLGLRPGTVLEFRNHRGRLIGTKATQDDPVEAVVGILKLDRTTAEVIEELRGAAE
jgi:antitoxin PrlF